TITGFGSVFVNGVEFSTSGATIVLDGNPAAESNLRVGMVVTVSGSRSGSSGSATRIEVDDAVKGFVEAKPDANHWTVMGQTVLVDDRTRFENNVQPGVGEFAEVHGLVVADGTISGGFIEKKDAPFPAFEVKGFVKNQNDTAKTFQIGTLTVNYDSALINDMPNPAGNAWNGLLVEAKGNTCATTPVCGTLTATKVEPNGPQMQEADEFEIEGFVTSLTSTGDFVVGNQRVVTTGSTRFEGGVAGDIAVGVKLEVEGVLSGGVLTASKVEFGDSIRIEADIDTVGTGSFTLRGLPGITVTANSLTQFEGGVNGLNNLVAGNHVRIRGRTSGSNTLIATEVEKRSADPRVELQGPIQSITGTSPNRIVTILGVAVDTTGVVFEDVNRATFFSQAVVGTLVKARGSLNGSTVTWSEMELED
ncbi:MAG TPA: DUF5666 domain-containing protein, partial [Polyangiaceae bacterium]|nr:DUF5666 domain-containing protein [Polyangiaceae bacterium]